LRTTTQAKIYLPHRFVHGKLFFYGAFETEERAREFERYLKSASGKAFGSKRLW
jgi:hypothetical protein